LSQSYVVPFYSKRVLLRDLQGRNLYSVYFTIALQSKVADAYPSGGDIRLNFVLTRRPIIAKSPSRRRSS